METKLQLVVWRLCHPCGGFRSVSKIYLLYALASKNSDNTRDTAVDNVNAHITSLEEYIDTDHGETVDSKFSNASIALKEMLAYLDKLSDVIYHVKSEASAANTKAEYVQEPTNIDKQQSLTLLHTLIVCL
eukprot:3344350-Ditylum_brightwellii.AAC.1